MHAAVDHRTRAGVRDKAEKLPGLSRQQNSGQKHPVRAWTVGDVIDVALESITQQLSEAELLEYATEYSMLDLGDHFDAVTA